MCEMYTAYTKEIDGVDEAVEELLEQIRPETLKKNSVGLLNCYSDFLEEGIAEALCEKLPFDVIGMTTMVSANQRHFDMYGLCLTVLTSDDIQFATAVTAPLSADNYRENIGQAYAQARARLPGEPALIVSYFPTLSDLGGDMMLNAFDAICRGAPIWGGLTAGVDLDYTKSLTFRNGEEIRENTLAMLLACGPLEPEFVVTSIPAQNIRENWGLITSCQGGVLREVNGMPLLDYLQDLGITMGRKGTTTLPVMVDYRDGSPPVALSFVRMKEDGGMQCSGDMPEGATIALGEITQEGILETTRTSLAKVLEHKRNAGLLMLPCVTRYVMLAPNQTDDIRLISETIAGRIPFMLGYCGGEICPVKDNNGRYHNRFHNYTFSACLI